MDGFVHREHEVEPLEVHGLHHARTQVAQVDPAPFRRLDRALVGRVPGVIAVRPRGIELEREFARLAPRKLPHHRLRRRGAADIAHAHEEDAGHALLRLRSQPSMHSIARSVSAVDTANEMRT